jgi:hypothetical protein
VPIDCQRKARHGTPFCPTECPAAAGGPVFDRIRVTTPADVPKASVHAVDVAVLDMNHGWPNVGHDAVVGAVQDVACDLSEILIAAGLKVRAVSFDVRGAGMIPEAGGRYALYLGTGGPGHIDPHLNDGRDPNAQGVSEDPSWEPRLFALFDDIASRPDVALLAVCHTFGVLCRWLDVADPVARGAEKGGKSEGVLENLLTDAGAAHPILGAMARHLAGGRRLRVLDSRIYDLVPTEAARGRIAILGTETLGISGPAGDAMTMMEIARDSGGRMPRMLAVNHHPEIADRTRLLSLLRAKLERGEIARAWYDDRVKTLERSFDDVGSDEALRVTSEFTFVGPLRFHLIRALRLRAATLGAAFPRHEDEIDRALSGT